MNDRLTLWVRDCEGLCTPDRVCWCDEDVSDAAETPVDGADERAARAAVVALTRVPEETVWPDELARHAPELAGSLTGRTMYVVPCVIALPSGLKVAAVEVTDSPALVAALRQRYAIDRGEAARVAQAGGNFTAVLHLAFPARRLVCHYGGSLAPRACRERPAPLPVADGGHKGAPCLACSRVCAGRRHDLGRGAHPLPVA